MSGVAEMLEEVVASRSLAGAATLVWREGQPAAVATAGRRDLQSRQPVERDTIFRIASMTKPVTTVAALTLLEEGRFALADPIADVVPELAHMRVLRDPEGPLDASDPAARPITFGDLLTHASGLTYGEFHRGPIAEALAAQLGPTIDNALGVDEWLRRLGQLPLIDQPGAGFHYGLSTDVLGFVIARLDGLPLGEALRRRVFEPLGMRDTGFTVPSANRDRRAGLCGFDDDGKLTALAATPGAHALAERPADMTFESGGQGLWSTLDDYLAFARLFIGAGSVDHVRVLRPETFALMTTNQLTPAQRAAARMFMRPIFATGHGYGMGVAVVTDPAQADPMRGRGHVGTVGWPGAYGGWWQADPGDRSVLIFLSHNMVELSQMRQGIGLDVWQAIAGFHAIASKITKDAAAPTTSTTITT
jgi:CubicO group peptidase (beta-lactamase class C family)